MLTEQLIQTFLEVEPSQGNLKPYRLFLADRQFSDAVRMQSIRIMQSVSESTP